MPPIGSGTGEGQERMSVFQGGLIRSWSPYSGYPPIQSLPSMTSPRGLDKSDTRKILESEHPWYSQHKHLWQDILDVYLGEDVEKFIYRHQREREAPWRARQQRAYLFNYVQSITDLIASFIFSKEIQRFWESPKEREQKIRQFRREQIMQDEQSAELGSEDEKRNQEEQVLQNPQQNNKNARNQNGQNNQNGKFQQNGNGKNGSQQILSPSLIEDRIQELLALQTEEFGELQEFWEDVDLRGTSIDDYMQMIHICKELFGHIDVFVDMPTIPDDQEIVNEQQRKALKLRPYLFVIFPIDLVNWEIGTDGEFEWVRWKERIVGDIGPFDKRPERPSWRYYTWTREEYYVHEIDYRESSTNPKVTQVAKGENPLKEIPITRFFNKKHLKYPLLGISAVRDIAKINLEILNLCSLIDESAYQNMFNLLVMQEPTEKKAAVEIGSNNVLLWEGDHPPFYLAPASEPQRFLLDLIQRCIQEIYRIAKLGGDTGVQEARSGIAYTWEFNQTNRMLADKADSMERGEYDLHRLWAKWMGLEWEGVINYPSNFNVERFDEELKELTQVKNSVRSPEFKRAIEKRLAARALSKIAPEERARINAEIDTMEEEKPMGFFPPPK